jgi:hypothetical protein
MARTPVADGESARRFELQRLRSDAKGLDVENDEGFSAVLQKTETLFGMSDGDLAEELLVSRPTISRWRNGRNLPHRAMRGPILEWIAKEAVRQLRFHVDEGPRSRRGAAVALEPA